MTDKNVGIVNVPGDSRAIMDGIKELENAGIPAVWLTTGAPGPDALTIFSAAAAITDTIKMGTAITPTWGQHPVYSVQQIQVIANLAPGRLRFGVGPSGKGGMIKTYGADFRQPVTNMREYIQVAKSLLQNGEVDFEGSHYQARAMYQALYTRRPGHRFGPWHGRFPCLRRGRRRCDKLALSASLPQ